MLDGQTGSPSGANTQATSTMFCPLRRSQKAMAQSPVPTAGPSGPRILAMLPQGTHWDHLLLIPFSVPCVVELGLPQREMVQAQPPLGQRRPPQGEKHRQLPAPSRGASRRGRRHAHPLDCGIWRLHPQHQPFRPLPTSPQFPSCLIHQPLCTMRPQDLPQPNQLLSGPPQPLPRQPGGTGIPSSFTWVTWRSSTRP